MINTTNIYILKFHY